MTPSSAMTSATREWNCFTLLQVHHLNDDVCLNMPCSVLNSINGVTQLRVKINATH